MQLKWARNGAGAGGGGSGAGGGVHYLLLDCFTGAAFIYAR